LTGYDQERFVACLRLPATQKGWIGKKWQNSSCTTVNGALDAMVKAAIERANVKTATAFFASRPRAAPSLWRCVLRRPTRSLFSRRGEPEWPEWIVSESRLRQ
jgi:hypothetical protein